MEEQHGNDVIRYVEQMNSSKGVAKDKLLLTIICSAAVVIAAVAIWHGLWPKPYEIDISSPNWECIACGNTFVKKTKKLPPIACPKCGREEAAAVHNQVCSKCGKSVPLYRMRLIESAREGYKNATGSGAGTGTVPLEAQYWIQRRDGSYGWTDWVKMYIPGAAEIRRSQKCPDCGESLLRGKR